ncbi:hypothetical protein GC105_10450 [Alkalibaculum sp. M08DMB]|uniref:FAD-dependent protein C-terminal domain-containing protein n=1 Tax=Alkalibaculum sporogenes TaxID=2655001 RepID=A0A6A7K9K4_9FIRM|nr:hypothetical protein [Alkalibaculum sporogenes]MPW26209.1 hypothetical protein [Alkalibaculum sporogenes]
MRYEIKNIKIPIEELKDDLAQYICHNLKIKLDEISAFNITSKSIDARKSHQDEINIIFSVVFNYSKDIKKGKTKWTIRKEDEIANVSSQIQSKERKFSDKAPIIVGFGPAGIFAALKLAEYGLNPIVLERGKDVDARTVDINKFWQDRNLDEDSNVQFGEGGAGAFSDGKLTTRVKDYTCKEILRKFVDAGAPEEIMYLNKPHVGTDKLRGVIKNMRNQIIDLGGQVLFNSCVTDILIEKGQVVGVEVNNKENYFTNQLILATGHSARDTYEMIIKRDISVDAKGFAIGLRIEHDQKYLNKIQYGKYYDHPKLKAADYQLAYRDDVSKRGVYSFCMCPGGLVVASSSEKGSVVTNGMSYYARNLTNANSALVVNINPQDFNNDPLEGIAFQRKYEKFAFEIGGKNYNAPVQLVGDFLKGKVSTHTSSIKPSYKPGTTPTDLAQVLPEYVSSSIRNALPYFDKKIKGFADYETVLTGVETRTSSPMRIVRNKETKESINVKGLFPVGEGAGYAGGIMSAAIDGIKCAYLIAASV